MLENPPPENHQELMQWDEALYEYLGWGISTYTQQKYIWCLHQIHLFRQDEELFNHDINQDDEGTENDSNNNNNHIKRMISKNILEFRKTELQVLLSQLETNQDILDHKNAINNNKKLTELNCNCCLTRTFCCCCLSNNSNNNDEGGGEEGTSGYHHHRHNDEENAFEHQNPHNRFNSNNSGHNSGVHGRQSSNNTTNGKTNRINMNDIFLFYSPQIFFSMVDLMFLLNTFYSALYFTQLLPICVAIGSGWWGLILFLPMLLGFNMLRFTLLRSVFLQAATTFDDDIAGAVIDDSIETLTIANTVRNKIIEKFVNVNQDMTAKNKLKVIKFVFQEMDQDNSGVLNKSEFRSFLGTLEVYLTKEKFNLLWRYLDVDNNGTLSRDEILLFIFPELKNAVKNEIKIIRKIRKKVSLEGWTDLDLQAIFLKFNEDKSGHMTKDELKITLISHPFSLRGINDQQLKGLFSTIDTDEYGNVTFEEFLSVCRSSNTNYEEENHRLSSEGRHSFNSKLPKNPSISSYTNEDEKDGFDGQPIHHTYSSDNYLNTTIPEETNEYNEDNTEDEPHSPTSPRHHGSVSSVASLFRSIDERSNADEVEVQTTHENIYGSSDISYSPTQQQQDNHFQNEEYDDEEEHDNYDPYKHNNEHDDDENEEEDTDNFKGNSISIPRPSMSPNNSGKLAPPPNTSPSTKHLLNSQSYLLLDTGAGGNSKVRPPPPLATSHRGDTSAMIDGPRRGSMSSALNFRFPWMKTSQKPPQDFSGYN